MPAWLLIAPAATLLLIFAVVVQQRTMGRVGKGKEMRWWRKGFWR